MSEWIACSDRMPELDVTVELLYQDTGETDTGHRYKFYDSDETDWNNERGLGDPSHWRPLNTPEKL